MKNHMLQHDITEISLPQNRCGLDKLKSKQLLIDIINIIRIFVFS